MNDVTFLIKTFERPDCLKRLVESIQRFYPNPRILVVDDSRTPTFLPQVQTLALPYDCGLSVGRNEGLRHLQTPYFVLLDDDYEFTARTRVDLMRTALVRHSLDIVGGAYTGTAQSPWEVFDHSRLEGKSALSYSPNRFQRGTLSPWLVKCDWTINFFLAKTETVRKIGGWNPRLKVQEHVEFFINCLGKAKVASLPRVQITHHTNKQLNSELYREMRYRPLFHALRDEEILKDYGLVVHRDSPVKQKRLLLHLFFFHFRTGGKGADAPLTTSQVREPIAPVSVSTEVKRAASS